MPEVPTGAKKPTDHKAKKAEANNEPVEVEFNGQTYTINPAVITSVDTAELFEDGLNMKALRFIVGAEQWDRWKDSNRNNEGFVPGEVLDEFFEKVGEVTGLGN